MRPSSSLLSASLLATSLLPVLAAQEAVDADAVAVLREHGLERSRVMEHLGWICDVYGPRLTGSPNLRRAQQWARETFEAWGLANVRLSEWGPFGRGWRLEEFDAEVVGDNPWPVLGWPKAWTPGLEGRVEAEAVLASGVDAEELAAMDLSDKFVLIDDAREVGEPFEPLARRRDVADLLRLATGARTPRPESERRRPPVRRDWVQRREVLRLVQEKRPLAILDRSYKGEFGTLFVTSASAVNPPGTSRRERARPWDLGAEVIPQVTLAVEHYNRLCRLLQKGRPVRLAMTLRARFFDGEPMQHNVVAEIPGTDPEIGGQVVMLGAHFDSWHSGTGATDNGCGSAVMMEAMRLLKTLVDGRGQGPRRTIRVALWSGEEQGLLGSRSWVREHLGTREEPTPAHGGLSAYYNLDNGTGRIRGVYLQGNEAVAPIFRAWLKPFWDLDATVVTLSNTGGTDHLAFDAVGVPGFQFVQDPIAYSTRTHHSNMDVWDHAVAEDLAQAATVIAAFAWHTAQRDELLPRKAARTSGGTGGR